MKFGPYSNPRGFASFEDMFFVLFHTSGGKEGVLSVNLKTGDLNFTPFKQSTIYLSQLITKERNQ